MTPFNSICAVISKIALEHVPPMVFAAARVGLAAPILWLIGRQLEQPQPCLTLRKVAVYAWLGFTGVFLPQGLVFVGIHLAGPDVTAIMQPTVPVMVQCCLPRPGLSR